MNFEELMKNPKQYWILSGSSKAYDLKEEIKAWAGYWVPEHKAWCIDDPDDREKKFFKTIGLVLQLRR